MNRTVRWNRYWDGKSPNYDREMQFLDRKLFGDSRAWACGQATGDVLEVAVGTGLNLPLYPDGVALTGIDLSEGMLTIARGRAERLGHPVTLKQADAHDLPFDADSFDTVVCTLGLCAIPDDGKALREMARVLRPGGTLILLDHIASSSRVVRGLQWLAEKITVPMAGEHFLRRPLDKIDGLGLIVERRERFKLGLVERLVARK
ncbi:class I SAM-dependent methyltransferase [Amycolatopsis oliviviridis]|uniref:Ubiquinone/menaquinone biosynthesis methyltransferase n=1 Tax=Amycolatopsis oliviviridis TaxID=1471590 RepID=A0ABQ3L4P2_9PSEU|nr:class I SAM-dependent methyltransferase [Amycolatopsis oliviviridis]GHH04537.1 ubiquinone/menaquinone biosynthesis methyltransferase [Amycolatopsis oliviviridis]